MRPTRPGTLLAAVVVLGVAGYLFAAATYFDLPPLPRLAPVTLVALAVMEAGLARIVRDRLRGRSTGRPLHPISVARAAALAKASSLGGSLLAGLYGGVFAWTFARRDQLASAGPDALVAGLSALSALALVVGALLLERACRTPDAGS